MISHNWALLPSLSGRIGRLQRPAGNPLISIASFTTTGNEPKPKAVLRGARVR